MASTHVLFEEDGAFKAGTVLADAGASLQVEAASGKRTKVKTSMVFLRFPAPSPVELLEQAHRAAEGIDLDFLWECAPQCFPRPPADPRALGGGPATFPGVVPGLE